MARTPAQVSQEIRAKLGVTAPSLSLEIGTPERKIVDAVSEAISESYIDNYVISSMWDIDTKIGIDLERFVSFFGFGRLQGRNSRGVLTFTLSAAAVQTVVLPLGTQAFKPGDGATVGAVYFITTETASIGVGQTSVNVPAMCQSAGTIGNVGANQITSFSLGIGVTSVTNAAPFINGTDTETDEQLRTRFKATALRNIAGTSDYFIGMCLQSDYVTRVAVIGPISRFREQLQTAAAAATSTITTAISKYTWPDGEYISTGLGTEDEVVYQPTTDYTITTAIPPVITIINTTDIPNGTVIDVEHEYNSVASRNLIGLGIANKVDVFMNGVQAVAVTEHTLVSSASIVFNTTTGSIYNRLNFVRRGTTTNPTNAARFQRLGFAPSIPQSFPASFSTFTEGTHYWVVVGTIANTDRGSQREVWGLEWIAGAPSEGTAITFNYSYNRLPELFDEMFRQNRPVATDVLTHEARFVYLRCHLIVVYNQGASVTAVNTNISADLRSFFEQMSYNTWIQISDVLTVVHNVPGVDNVRLTLSSDNGSNFGIRKVTYAGTTITSHVVDFLLADDELPVFFDAVITRKAANNF